MRVLIACEFSGVVREAFRAKGHEAWSCDLRPAEDKSPFHFKIPCEIVIPKSQNERNRPTKDHPGWLDFSQRECAALYGGWDMLIAHPPCTDLSLSGNRWAVDHWVKRKGGNRWHDGSEKRESQKRPLISSDSFWIAAFQCDALKTRCREPQVLLRQKTRQFTRGNSDIQRKRQRGFGFGIYLLWLRPMMCMKK